MTVYFSCCYLLTITVVYKMEEKSFYFCFLSQRGGNPRCSPPLPRNPPLSPRKFGRFLSLPRSPPLPIFGPPRPPLGAPPPRSDFSLTGDLGLSLSISSVQPDKWELGNVKFDAKVSGLKLVFVSVGPTVTQPRNRKKRRMKNKMI